MLLNNTKDENLSSILPGRLASKILQAWALPGWLVG